jgi:hypothetical protein
MPDPRPSSVARNSPYAAAAAASKGAISSGAVKSFSAAMFFSCCRPFAAPKESSARVIEEIPTSPGE